MPGHAVGPSRKPLRTWCWPLSPQKTGLGQFEVGEVDRDEERLFHQLIITFVGVNPSFGRHDDAVDVLICGGIVEAGPALEDVDRVVVSAQQAVRSEAGDLLARVAFHCVGKGDLQAPPGLPYRALARRLTSTATWTPPPTALNFRDLRFREV